MRGADGAVAGDLTSVVPAIVTLTAAVPADVGKALAG
jgi:hypothetical protein